MFSQIIFLPEAADYIATSGEESKALCTTADQSPFVTDLCDAAKHHNINVSIAIHETGRHKGRIMNNLLWINKQGQIEHRYSKIHLLEIAVPGGPCMKEEEVIAPGDQINEPFASPIGRIGGMICFDLRFPELARVLVQKGAEVLLYPAAFLPHTGRKHWKPLLQARAIETQSYVIASDQTGQHHENRASYGHSLVVDPSGEVIAELGEEEKSLLFVDIDPSMPAKVRKEQLLKHRMYTSRTSLR